MEMEVNIKHAIDFLNYAKDSDFYYDYCVMNKRVENWGKSINCFDNWIKVDYPNIPEGDLLLLTNSKAIIIGDWYKNQIGDEGWRTTQSAWYFSPFYDKNYLSLLKKEEVVAYQYLPPIPNDEKPSEDSVKDNIKLDKPNDSLPNAYYDRPESWNVPKKSTINWIKANERLPEKEDEYFIYVDALKLKKVSYFNGKNFEHQFTNKDFKWLDEGTILTKQEVKENIKAPIKTYLVHTDSSAKIIETSGFEAALQIYYARHTEPIMAIIDLYHPLYNEVITKQYLHFKELEDILKQKDEYIKDILNELGEKEVMINAFDKVRKLFEMRSWIMEGRGSYPYNDDRYKEEARYLFDEFDALQKDVWRNIKTKTFEYREKIISNYKENQI